MAKACLGKVVDDDVVVQTPSGEVDWYIVDIEYQTQNQYDSQAGLKALSERYTS